MKERVHAEAQKIEEIEFSTNHGIFMTPALVTKAKSSLEAMASLNERK